MSDFIQGGWSLFIAAITIIGIMACIWLLFSQSKKSVEIDIDSNQIEKIIDDVISQNKDKVAEIIAGKDRLLPWFVGQVMKLSKGKANPDLVNKLLNTKIYK
jgi:Asp-tRNA(Asn)/Glu-tRNA(Gln) amidotransferase B subunit